MKNHVGAPLVGARKILRAGTRPALTNEGGGVIDLVVNATSVGLQPSDPALVRPENFSGRTLFYDLVYNPRETRLIREARRSGHRALNGLGMLFYQGAEAFRLWTGKRPPLKEMRAEIESSLRGAKKR